MSHDDLALEQNDLSGQLSDAGFAVLSDDQLDTIAGGITQYEIEKVETDVKVMKYLGIGIGQAWRSKKTGMEEGKCDWTQEMLDYMIEHWNDIK